MEGGGAVAWLEHFSSFLASPGLAAWRRM
jgi:hypothetical protein